VTPIFTLIEVAPQDVKEYLPFFDDFKGNEVEESVVESLVPGLRFRPKRKIE
jgi:hypothetical protein